MFLRLEEGIQQALFVLARVLNPEDMNPPYVTPIIHAHICTGRYYPMYNHESYKKILSDTVDPIINQIDGYNHLDNPTDKKF